MSIALFNCQNKETFGKARLAINNCSDNLIKSYDSLFVVMSNKFSPKDIDFDKSIKLNEDVDKFIDSIKQNDKCLYKSEELNTFVVILLLKQYKFHLQNYHQGYDLFSMCSGNAKYIIGKYLLLINKKSNDLEMLNSGYIVEFLNTTKAIKLNDSEKKLLDTVNKMEIELQKQQREEMQ